LISPDASHGVTSDDLRIAFQDADIEARLLWKPMHRQPVFSSYPYYGNNIAESLFDNGLCLPSGSNLTNHDRVRIAAVVYNKFNIKFLSKLSKGYVAANHKKNSDKVQHLTISAQKKPSLAFKLLNSNQ
jgi:hypothetical protein